MNTKTLPERGSSANTPLTKPTNPVNDFRRSTGSRYAKIRRTLGITHIASPAQAQSDPIRQGDLNVPPPHRSRWGHQLDKLAYPLFLTPTPPIPLLKAAQRELLTATELLWLQPTARKVLTNRAPLG